MPSRFISWGVKAYKISTIVDSHSVRQYDRQGVKAYKISTIVDGVPCADPTKRGVKAYKISTIVDHRQLPISNDEV